MQGVVVSMSLAYELGYRAGLRERAGKNYVRACPFEGHNSASMELQLRWMAGWFDAYTRRRSKELKRKNLKPRRPNARVRWPRSEYARRLVQVAMGVAP
jgi:hypothetical protein